MSCTRIGSFMHTVAINTRRIFAAVYRISSGTCEVPVRKHRPHTHSHIMFLFRTNLHNSVRRRRIPIALPSNYSRVERRKFRRVPEISS